MFVFPLYIYTSTGTNTSLAKSKVLSSCWLQWHPQWPWFVFSLTKIVSFTLRDAPHDAWRHILYLLFRQIDRDLLQSFWMSSGSLLLILVTAPPSNNLYNKALEFHLGTFWLQNMYREKANTTWKERVESTTFVYSWKHNMQYLRLRNLRTRSETLKQFIQYILHTFQEETKNSRQFLRCIEVSFCH